MKKKRINPRIFDEYRRIIDNENRLKGIKMFSGDSAILYSAPDVYHLAKQMAEIAKASLLPRGYIKRYNLSDAAIAYESIGAHTNLVMALVDRALSYYYGPDFGEPTSKWQYTTDGYSYREIMEAVRIHDLPENRIGDWPDNGSTNKNKKTRLEQRYFKRFTRTYPPNEDKLVGSAMELFRKMDDPLSRTGRLLKLADKTAALIITLCYDDANASPIIYVSDPNLSARDSKEIEMCDWNRAGYHKASEMWTIDHFRIRKFIYLDDDNFFTAIIVMYTLMVNHGKWYSWREKDY